LLDTFELHEGGSGIKSICYCLQIHTNGNETILTFSFPHSCVGWGGRYHAFFVAEKEKQEAKAREMGKAT